MIAQPAAKESRRTIRRVFNAIFSLVDLGAGVNDKASGFLIR